MAPFALLLLTPLGQTMWLPPAVRYEPEEKIDPEAPKLLLFDVMVCRAQQVEHRNAPHTHLRAWRRPTDSPESSWLPQRKLSGPLCLDETPWHFGCVLSAMRLIGAARSHFWPLDSLRPHTHGAGAARAALPPRNSLRYAK